MDAVHAGLTPRLEFLRGGDVRQDHELLDQPMAVEPGHAGNRDGLLFGVEHDTILVDVETERASVRSGLGECRKRSEQRRQSFLRQGHSVAVTASSRSLGLLIG